MKYIFIILAVCLFASVALSDDKLTGSANLAYTHGGKREALVETLRLGFKYNVYTHPTKAYIFYVGGNALTERDVFNNIARINGFITFGLEY